MKFRIVLSVLLFTFLVGSLSAQGVYRWVDDDGNVHFTDTPPEDDRDVDRVQVRGGPSELEEDENGNGEEDARPDGPRLSEAECDGMRERLEQYQDADVLYRITEEGEQEELEPEVAQAEMDRLAQQIDDYCD